MSGINTYEYKLYLGISIEDAEDSRLTLVLTKDAQDIVIDNKNCIISLNGFKFYRKIYEPGLIEAEVAIALQKTGDLPAMDEVTKLLLKRMANLTIKPENSTETAIAQNYYVYEALPQLTKNNGKASLNVKLMIYSLDKLMTLDKYCKAYVGMKLGADILLPESLTFGFGGQSLLKACVGQLQQLKYKNNDIVLEKIQPYLVQYNESFYDFMVRTANRCGELFYFEDGQLNLGRKVEESDTTVTITDYQNVTMVNYSKNVLDVNPYYRDSVKELDDKGEVKKVKELNFEPIDKNKAGFPEEAFPEDKSNPYTYNQEEATDEYIYPLEKDKWTTMKYEMGFGTAEGGDLAKAVMGSLALSIIGNELKNTKTEGTMNLIQFLENIITEWGKATAKSALALSKIKKTKNETHIEKQKIIDKGNQTGDNKFVGFATLNQEGWITSKLYYDIRKHQIEQQKKMICIDMGATYQSVKLGQKIKVDGLSDNDIYIVVQIEQMSNNAWVNNYKEYGRDVNDVRAGSPSQIIYAIPAVMKDTDVKVVYPPLSVQTYREAGPQTAFVIDNKDPKYQGRVRIIYPWQTQNEAKHKALKSATLATLGADKTVRDLKVKLENLRCEKQFLEDEKKLIDEYVTICNAYKLANFIKKESKPTPKDWIEQKKSEKAADEETIKKWTITAEDELNLNEDDYQEKVKMQSELEKAQKHLELLEAVLKLLEDNSSDKPNMIVAKIITKNEEINTTNTALTTAEAALKTTLESLKVSVNEFTLELVQKASPWVRVATPSATSGGGTYFKPQVGDEVLVNYDNNNVERPYVVGSLFSKNVPTPEEANSFTCANSGLLNGASTYIVSPNGHHIAFNDPKDGSKLMAGVQGGITEIIGWAGYKFEDLKDLAGGIHIGDRYGLYELSMSSHDRKIKVRSPFGDVNIDAFTGITINAPNGDIKISGKNVEITAGNNLVLKSGLNIQAPLYTHPTKGGIAGNIADKLVTGIASGVVDMYASQFIDMKLIRQLTEVFLRPIEGTLEVKSNRYLKLEAGIKTSAAIPAERYETKDNKINEVAVAEIEFMSKVVACVQYINDTVKGFIETYKTKWDALVDQKVSYNSLLGSLLKEDVNIPDVLKDIIKKGMGANTDAEWTDVVKNGDFDGKIIEGVVSINGTNHTDMRLKKAFLRKSGNQLAEAVYELHKHVNNYQKLFDNPTVPGGADDKMKELMKETFDERKGDKVTQWNNMYYDGNVKDAFLQGKMENMNDDVFVKFGDTGAKKFKRAFAAIFIARVANAPEYQMDKLGDGAHNAFTNFMRNPLDLTAKGKFLHVHFKPEDVKEDKLESEFHWHHFLANMQRPQNVLARRAYDILAGTAKKYLQVDEFAKIADRKVWADRGRGTILMSDDTGETTVFDRGKFTKDTKATNGSWDALIITLKGIK